MRDIKFRAWDKSEDEWFNHPYYRMQFDGTVMANFSQAVWTPVTDRLHLMQYTGLKDKNGVEIYEGDIVTSLNRLPEQVTGVVEYSEFNAGYSVKFDPFLSNYRLHAFAWEVIGNIYENPELLEQQ